MHVYTKYIRQTNVGLARMHVYTMYVGTTTTNDDDNDDDSTAENDDDTNNDSDNDSDNDSVDYVFGTISVVSTNFEYENRGDTNIDVEW